MKYFALTLLVPAASAFRARPGSYGATSGISFAAFSKGFDSFGGQVDKDVYDGRGFGLD